MRRAQPEHIEKTGPKEILWFVGLWAGGVAAVALVATAIKLVLRT
jgi:hypothetical protein